MLVFYYQNEDDLYAASPHPLHEQVTRTHLVCVKGNWYPAKHSPIWQRCNTCVMLVPGTGEDDDDI